MLVIAYLAITPWFWKKRTDLLKRVTHTHPHTVILHW